MRAYASSAARSPSAAAPNSRTAEAERKPRRECGARPRRRFPPAGLAARGGRSNAASKSGVSALDLGAFDSLARAATPEPWMASFTLLRTMSTSRARKLRSMQHTAYRARLPADPRDGGIGAEGDGDGAVVPCAAAAETRRPWSRRCRDAFLLHTPTDRLPSRSTRQPCLLLSSFLVPPRPPF